MTKTNEIVAFDYWCYIIDIDLELYFQQDKNIFDNINFEILNLSRRTYKEQFWDVINEIMDTFNFK